MRNTHEKFQSINRFPTNLKIWNFFRRQRRTREYKNNFILKCNKHMAMNAWESLLHNAVTCTHIHTRTRATMHLCVTPHRENKCPEKINSICLEFQCYRRKSRKAHDAMMIRERNCIHLTSVASVCATNQWLCVFVSLSIGSYQWVVVFSLN